MSKGPAQYILVSLPTHISPSRDPEEAFDTLKATVSTDYGTTYQFKIPSFKIGTVDALISQADELSKLSQTCEGVVGKVADGLRSILDGDEEKIAQQKTINDSQLPGVVVGDIRDCWTLTGSQNLSTSTCALSRGTRSNTARTSPWGSW